MKIKMFLPAVFLLFMMLVFATCVNAERDDHEARPGHGLQLPQKYKALFQDEMRMLEKEMQALLPAVAKMDWHVIHDKGLAIYNGFILRQRLSRHEHEELHDLLPGGFLEMDLQFHAYGKRLAHAAEAKDGELVGYYYGRMVQACIACHGKYVPARSAGLSENGVADHQH